MNEITRTLPNDSPLRGEHVVPDKKLVGEEQLLPELTNDPIALAEKLQKMAAGGRISKEGVVSLMDILQLILKMLTLMQETAILERNTMLLKTNFLNRYTDIIGEMKLKTPADLGIDPSKGGSDEKTKAKMEELQRLNTEISYKIESLKSKQGMWSNQAKATESDLNTAQAFVNQTVDIYSSLIQQFSTLVSMIWR